MIQKIIAPAFKLDTIVHALSCSDWKKHTAQIGGWENE